MHPTALIAEDKPLLAQALQAGQAFEAQAVDYLLKPVQTARL